MPDVELRFSALPAHVRTARMVAVAVARRSGLQEEVLDEVRLAVGEACSRAVELHRRHCPDRPVEVILSDEPARFAVTVTDQGGPEQAADSAALQSLGVSLHPTDASGDGNDAADADATEVLPSGVGLAVISGLVDDVDISTGESGSTVRMAWPVA